MKNKTKIHLVSKAAKGSEYGKRQKYSKVCESIGRHQGLTTGTRCSFWGSCTSLGAQGLNQGLKGSFHSQK